MSLKITNNNYSNIPLKENENSTINTFGITLRVNNIKIFLIIK